VLQDGKSRRAKSIDFFFAGICHVVIVRVPAKTDPSLLKPHHMDYESRQRFILLAAAAVNYATVVCRII